MIPGRSGSVSASTITVIFSCGCFWISARTSGWIGSVESNKNMGSIRAWYIREINTAQITMLRRITPPDYLPYVRMSFNLQDFLATVSSQNYNHRPTGFYTYPPYRL